jgi:hypothetical protein
MFLSSTTVPTNTACTSRILGRTRQWTKTNLVHFKKPTTTGIQRSKRFGETHLMKNSPTWKSETSGTSPLARETMSSSKAEYVAMAKGAKEIKFVVMVLLSMGISVTMPIVVRIDNIGAMFMAEDYMTSNRTKHIDMHYHFVRE